MRNVLVTNVTMRENVSIKMPTIQIKLSKVNMVELL